MLSKPAVTEPEHLYVFFLKEMQRVSEYVIKLTLHAQDYWWSADVLNAWGK